MCFLISILLNFLWSKEVLCNILTQHNEAIQSYMMTGYESEWQYCDRLSDNSDYSNNEPQIIMKLDDIQTLNLKSALAYSTCLLVHYDVSSRESLSALVEFGWKAINHVRLAIVITLQSGITLEMAKNTSNLPYLVAAQLDDGKKQFLCPIVGEVKPVLGQEMCKKSYLSYKGKKIRMGGTGLLPDAYITRPGRMNARIILSSDRSKTILTMGSYNLCFKKAFLIDARTFTKPFSSAPLLLATSDRKLGWVPPSKVSRIKSVRCGCI